MREGERQIINMQSCGTFQEFFFSSLEDIDMKNKINLILDYYFSEIDRWHEENFQVDKSLTVQAVFIIVVFFLF